MRRPKQLGCGVEIVRTEPVDLKVYSTEHFLIGQALVEGRVLIDLRVSRLAGAERNQLPPSLQQDDLTAASRVVELLRLILRQP